MENKQFRNFEIENQLDWCYGISILKLRDDLDRLEKLGATHIEIVPYDDYGSPYVRVNAYANRLETNEEYSARISKENFDKEMIQLKEMQQLRELQEKYGKDI